MCSGYHTLNRRNKPVKATEDNWYQWSDANEDEALACEHVYTNTPLGCITVTVRFSGFCGSLFYIKVESCSGAEPVFVGDFDTLKEAKAEHKRYVERLTKRYQDAEVLLTEDEWWNEERMA